MHGTQIQNHNREMHSDELEILSLGSLLTDSLHLSGLEAGRAVGMYIRAEVVSLRY